MKKTSKLVFLILFGIASCQQNPYQQGERLYEIHCANCHMSEGEGLAALYPPLTSTSFERFAPRFACIVRYGLSDTISVNGQQFSFPMPGNDKLNPVEIANIYNYIVYQWHPTLKPITSDKMQNDLLSCTIQ